MSLCPNAWTRNCFYAGAHSLSCLAIFFLISGIARCLVPFSPPRPGEKSIADGEEAMGDLTMKLFCGPLSHSRTLASATVAVPLPPLLLLPPLLPPPRSCSCHSLAERVIRPSSVTICSARLASSTSCWASRSSFSSLRSRPASRWGSRTRRKWLARPTRSRPELAAERNHSPIGTRHLLVGLRSW